MARRVWPWVGLGILAAVGTALVLTGMRQPHHSRPPVHVTRAVSWGNPPGAHSTGWQRERWIVANQPAWIQREWRAASCPPLRTEYAGTTMYYFRFAGQPGEIGAGAQTVYDPPVGLMSDLPWYGNRIPATGFPFSGQKGCQ